MVSVDESGGKGWVEALVLEFGKKKDFWRGGEVILALGGRVVDRGELLRAQELFLRFGLELRTVLSASETTRLAAEDLGFATHLPRRGYSVGRWEVPSEALAKSDAQSPEPEGRLPGRKRMPARGASEENRKGNDDETYTSKPERSQERESGFRGAGGAFSTQLGHAVDPKGKRMKRQRPPKRIEMGGGHVCIETLRSGRSLRHDGHLIVIGDVNAGAEVIAGGDVIVWGKVRGLVHAGAYGDDSAVICALELTPTQLRISGKVAITPNDKRKKSVPEMALIREGQIVADPWPVRP